MWYENYLWLLLATKWQVLLILLCGLLLTFIIEGSYKFYLEFNENKDVIFPIQLHLYPYEPLRDARLGTPALALPVWLRGWSSTYDRT